MAYSTGQHSAPMGAAEEKRRHPRMEAKVRLTASSDGAPIQIVSTNLSAGGAYCTSPARFPVMTRLAVTMDLPAGDLPRPLETLAFSAVVVRCEADLRTPGLWNLALFFTDCAPSTVEKLTHFLRTHARTQPTS